VHGIRISGIVIIEHGAPRIRDVHGIRISGIVWIVEDHQDHQDQLAIESVVRESEAADQQ
jgi:hypothetical protein